MYEVTLIDHVELLRAYHADRSDDCFDKYLARQPPGLDSTDPAVRPLYDIDEVFGTGTQAAALKHYLNEYIASTWQLTSLTVAHDEHPADRTYRMVWWRGV